VTKGVQPMYQWGVRNLMICNTSWKRALNYGNDDDVVLVRPLTKKTKGGKSSPC
jgi:hypothetical protein